MLSVGIYTMLRGFRVKINKALQKLIQAGAGGIAGLSMDHDSILNLPSYIIPIIALNAIIAGGCLIPAFVLYKATGRDIATCLIGRPGSIPAVNKLSKQPVIASARQLPGEAIQMRVWIAGARCAPWR
jgi:uncharacterized membrane protein AbrB (regulator of aidB expression)